MHPLDPIIAAERHAQAMLDAADMIGPIPNVPALPLMLARADWPHTTPVLHLLAHGLPVADDNALRVAAIEAWGNGSADYPPLPPGEATRAYERYRRRIYRHPTAPAKAEWLARAQAYVEARLGMVVNAFPSIPDYQLRGALYGAFEIENPAPTGDELAASETPAERLARLEQWAREGREIHWRLHPSGSEDRRLARAEADELKVVRDRLKREARATEKFDKGVLAGAERVLRAAVPGTVAWRNAQAERLAAAGRLRYNKPWVERVLEDEIAIARQGVLRPTPLRPHTSKPLVVRPAMVYNSQRWED